MSPARRYTPYYRVSTQKQGTSGLGLEAQQAAVRAFVSDPAQLGAEYVEIESGKKNQRPQLLAAIAEARRVGATLLIAKLDRLSRNAGFIFTLRDSGVDFVCCDMPDANTLTVGLFAVIAQHERETISKRTKDALAAKKARGARLGSPQNFTSAVIAQGQAAMQANARAHQANRQAAQLVELLRAKGQTLWHIAARLNESGYRTRRGEGVPRHDRAAPVAVPASSCLTPGGPDWFTRVALPRWPRPLRPSPTGLPTSTTARKRWQCSRSTTG